jgi:hypothetical protein
MSHVEAVLSCFRARKVAGGILADPAIIWFSRRLAAVAVIKEASSVLKRNDAEDLDALA